MVVVSRKRVVLFCLIEDGDCMTEQNKIVLFFVSFEQGRRQRSRLECRLGRLSASCNFLNHMKYDDSHCLSLDAMVESLASDIILEQLEVEFDRAVTIYKLGRADA